MCIVHLGPEDVRTQTWDKDKVRGYESLSDAVLSFNTESNK
jgi:hypothetical protein